jgi:preprotein translocase subunit SecG
LCVFSGGGILHTLFVILLAIVSVGLILVVILQSGKSAGLSGAISGGAEQLFGKQKARGLDLILHRVTVVLSVLFFVLTVLVSYFAI